MYYVNKIVGWMTSPIGLFFIGIVVSFGLSFVAKRKNETKRRWVLASRWVFFSSIGFLWIMSCGVTTRLVGASLESEWAKEGCVHGDIDGLPEADAIVVLGGGMGRHPKCGAAEMFGSADRVWQGAKLFKAGKAKLISLSGPDVEKSTVPLMEDFGVPRSAMLYFSDARNTEEESKMIYSSLQKVVKDRKPKILLVTSAWHMDRSVLLFERVGFDVVAAPTDFEMSYMLETPLRFSDFFPSAEALVRNSYAIKEWVGNIGYRLFRR